MNGFLTLVSVLGALFFLLGGLVQSQVVSFCFALSKQTNKKQSDNHNFCVTIAAAYHEGRSPL